MVFSIIYFNVKIKKMVNHLILVFDRVRKTKQST